MKVAIVHYACSPIVGGVESIMTTHARLFAEEGFDPYLLAGRGDPASVGLPGAIIPELDSLNPVLQAAQRELRVEAEGAEAAFDEHVEHVAGLLREALAGAAACIVHNAFTLHKNLVLTAALTRLAREMDSMRWIAWCHDLAWNNPLYRDELRPKWPWTLLKEHLPNVTYVAISEQRRLEMAHLFDVQPDEVRLVPTGIDPVAFLLSSPQMTAIRERLRWNERDWVFLTPVRITRRKNIELAIKVIAAIRDRGHNPLLVVTGPPGPHNERSGQYVEELLALREGLGLQDHVSFLGLEEAQVSDALMIELYRWVDGLLLTSAQEGFGLPLIEAGLLRVPIFCGDIPVLREVGGTNALYFPLTDPPEAIARMVLDTLEKSGPAAMRRRVLTEYSWDNIFHEKILPLVL
jgi:glycosyltransferase involved in cell wall biosynthesis